jgi:hypothetical protein
LLASNPATDYTISLKIDLVNSELMFLKRRNKSVFKALVIE